MPKKPITIQFIGGPYDGKEAALPELLEYVVLPFMGKDLTYIQSGFPYRYFYQAEEYK